MSIKSVFDNALKDQQASVARQALAEALGGQLPAAMTVAQLLEELRAEPALDKAFLALRVSELREMLCPTTAGHVPGPTRKRGVTSGRIVDYVAAHPGCRRSDLMAALGLKGGTVSSQLRMLRTRGLLRGEGAERDFRYFVA